MHICIHTCIHSYIHTYIQLDRLATLGVIPIVNENDAVTWNYQTDSQPVFSDNDMLSAIIAAGSEASGLALCECLCMCVCVYVCMYVYDDIIAAGSEASGLALCECL